MVKSLKRFCKICLKPIKINQIKYKGRTTSFNPQGRYNFLSDEGVLFNLNEKGRTYLGGAWFCNDCWKLIIGKTLKDNEINKLLNVVTPKKFKETFK